MDWRTDGRTVWRKDVLSLKSIAYLDWKPCARGGLIPTPEPHCSPKDHHHERCRQLGGRPHLPFTFDSNLVINLFRNDDDSRLIAFLSLSTFVLLLRIRIMPPENVLEFNQHTYRVVEKNKSRRIGFCFFWPPDIMKKKPRWIANSTFKGGSRILFAFLMASANFTCFFDQLNSFCLIETFEPNATTATQWVIGTLKIPQCPNHP